jgi:hypothetical protein
MKNTYRRIRPSHEVAISKKENKQEQSFFGEMVHEPFFRPAAAVAQPAVINRQCADCKKEEKQVQRAEDKKEEEKKIMKKEDKKEEQKVQRQPEKKEEDKVMKKEDKKEEEKVQRQPEKKEEEKLQREPEKGDGKVMKAEDKKEEDKLHKKEAGTSATPSKTVSNYIGSLNGKGQSLAPQANSFFSSKMGYDFTDVKVHTDKEAAESAKAVNAKAYTIGNNVVFNEGQYDTESGEGKKLMAHELTHVMQQGAVQRKKILRLPGHGSDDPVHEGMVGTYRERRGLPADGRDETGSPVGPSDADIKYRHSSLPVSSIASELQQIFSTGGVNPLLIRMRTLTVADRSDPDILDFIERNLSGNSFWAANNFLTYGSETSWPVNFRVRRELLSLPGSGGAIAVQTILSTASDADKVTVINDTVTMDLIRALPATDRQALGVLLVNLAAIPAGNAQAAAAELLFSTVIAERNTILRIANGEIRIFYIENLTHPANEAALLTGYSLDPAIYTIYNRPDGSPGTVIVQRNFVGFRVNGTNMIAGNQGLAVDRWRTLLTHETNHARNPDPVTPLENFRSEFRAYWIAEFSSIADLDTRARMVREHILHDYPSINAAYTSDAAVRAAIDAHTRPDGNITNQ